MVEMIVRGKSDEPASQRFYLQQDWDDASPREELLNMNIARILEKHYPGHRWAISCKEHTGMATIKNVSLSRHYGYYLNLRNCQKAADLEKAVMRAGGEILERYYVERKRADQDEMWARNKKAYFLR